MTRPGATLTALAVTIVLVGCSSHKKPQPAITTSEPVPTPSSSVATTTQWTQLVSAKSKAIYDTYDKIKKCPVSPKADDIVCGIGWFAYGEQVTAFARDLRAAQDSAEPTYLGTPPPTLTALVTSTLDAADAMGEVDQARTNQCTEGKLATAPCKKAQEDWAAAKDKFMDVLGGWKSVK